MKVHYISDTHLDFWIRESNPQSPKFEKQINEYCEMICLRPADVLIIAGDLGHYYAQDSAFLLKCKDYYKHVILVRGNHDMYLVSNNLKKRYMYDSMNRVNELKRFCRENDIHYLDGDIICIDGYNFAGVGMSWDKSYFETFQGPSSDFKVRDMYNEYMNDAKLIYSGKDNYEVPTAYGGRYTESSFDPFHYFKKEYEKLSRIQDYDNIDVMVSHYGPIIPETMRESYKNESTTFFFFDGVKDIRRISPKYWIFGHTHDDYDFMVDDTRMLVNPLGYPGENTYNIVKEIILE